MKHQCTEYGILMFFETLTVESTATAGRWSITLCDGGYVISNRITRELRVGVGAGVHIGEDVIDADHVALSFNDARAVEYWDRGCCVLASDEWGLSSALNHWCAREPMSSLV